MAYRTFLVAVPLKIRSGPGLKILAVPWILDVLECTLDVAVEGQDSRTSQELFFFCLVGGGFFLVATVDTNIEFSMGKRVRGAGNDEWNSSRERDHLRIRGWVHL